MKSPEEYLDISKLSFKSKLLQREMVKKWIKQAQIDAYNEALDDVVENAKLTMGREKPHFCLKPIVDKQSILKLKK